MLYPQTNRHRQCHDLSGIWELRFDPGDDGRTANWQAGFTASRPAAVPASWNEQFADERDNLGPAWYQTRFDLPWEVNGKSVFLRFGSVNYLAEVWLNGHPLGAHEGGHLPFEFAVTPHLKPEGNLLVVRVDGNLAADHVPPGNVKAGPEDIFVSHSGNFPETQFDFFPYCGIQRPVLLYTVPRCHIADLTVLTSLKGGDATVTVQVTLQTNEQEHVSIRLQGQDYDRTTTAFCTGTTELTLEVPHARLWSPDDPYLYNLTASLSGGDTYRLPVGIRTIAIEGDRLLLNGKPIYLTGFGRHEDFPVLGRAMIPAVIVKDFALLKWIGANSFRTSHYPYSEQMMDLADRLGFLVIDETPAVGLFFRADGLDKRLSICKQYVRELIARDKNHPSVVLWSLANEPHSHRPEAAPFFRQLYDLAKSLDASRPVTLVSHVGVREEAFDFLDVVCMNRYYGWYTQTGRIEEGIALLSAEMDAIHERYPKPFILTEFGADAIAGSHAQPPEMFTEEYQAELIRRYIEVARSKPFVVGEHIWNMCDFKTAQGVTRVHGLNHKGVFTRDRRPKLAAHLLRRLWKGDESI